MASIARISASTFTAKELAKTKSVVITAGGSLIEDDPSPVFVSSIIFNLPWSDVFLMMCKDASMFKIKAYTTEDCDEEAVDLKGFNVELCISSLDELEDALKSLKI